jgi:hypothetical protein
VIEEIKDDNSTHRNLFFTAKKNVPKASDKSVDNVTDGAIATN